MTDATRIALAPLAWEDYLVLPAAEPPVEIVHGQPVVNPAPVGPHQRMIGRLYRVLDDHCPTGYEAVMAPWDWVLWRVPDLLVRQPDVVVVTHEQADGPRLEVPPLLAVEVLSTEGFERDVVTKRSEYARVGLEHYWIVDVDVPEIVVYRAVDQELVEAARAAGDQTLRLDQPFPVALQLSTLLAHR